MNDQIKEKTSIFTKIGSYVVEKTKAFGLFVVRVFKGFGLAIKNGPVNFYKRFFRCKCCYQNIPCDHGIW